MLWSCWCLYIVWNNVFVHGTMCFKHILVWGVWKELCRPQCLFQEYSWQLLLWSLLCMLMISFGIKCNLSKKFETVDLGEIHYCLGIQVNCIWQDQTIYIYNQTKWSNWRYIYAFWYDWKRMNKNPFYLPIVNFKKIWVFIVM